MVLFKMRDSVPSVRYSSVCIVLRLWRISLIPTYRVYRLYDRVYRLYDRIYRFYDYSVAKLGGYYYTRDFELINGVALRIFS